MSAAMMIDGPTAHTRSNEGPRRRHSQFKEGMSGGVQTEVPPAQASAPSDLSAKPGHNQVTLNWNGSAGASGYNVKRSSTSGGPYALIASTAATSYSDEGLASATYYYVVAIVGFSGESVNSIDVGATPA